MFNLVSLNGITNEIQSIFTNNRQCMSRLDFISYDESLEVDKRKITQIQYKNFLTAWYNMILNTRNYCTLHELVYFLKNDNIIDGVPYYCNVAVKPGNGGKQYNLGKYYPLLFKFICSLPPYMKKHKMIADYMRPRLEKNGYIVDIKTSIPINERKATSQSINGNPTITFYV